MDVASDAPAARQSGPISDQDRIARVRDNMVDSQVRPNRVTDPRLLAGMRRLPRERFLPPAMRHLAYLDTEVRLPRGRALLEPMVIARLIQLLAPAAGERALVIGAGTGYAAALLAACGAAVTALEEDADLLGLARAVLPEVAPVVRLVSGPLAAGWPADAPYEMILIDGAVAAIPPSLASQLTPDTGRLVAIVAHPDGALPPGLPVVGSAVLAEATPAGLRPQPAFDCTASLIPALLPAPAFSF